MEHYHNITKKWDEDEGLYELNTLVFSAYDDLNCGCEYEKALENELTKRLGWNKKGFVNKEVISLEMPDTLSLQIRKQRPNPLEHLCCLISLNKSPTFKLSVKSKSKKELVKPVYDFFDTLIKVGIKNLPRAS